MVKKELVALYVRKSRLKDVDSMEISRQIELLTDYADKNNIEYEIFSEEGSSEDFGRPEFQRMIMDIKRGKFEGILVTDLDRITRDRTDFGLFTRILQYEGLVLHTLSKSYSFLNDEDMLMLGRQSEMDNHFMRMTKRKLRRGRIQAIKKGVYFGIAPYGYTKDDKTKHLKSQSVEAETVREIYRLYVHEGLNQAEICEQLTLRGKLTRAGKPFTVRAVSLILSNVAYRGIVHYELEGDEPIHVEDAHEALIDVDTFNKAQVIRAEKRKVPQSSQRGVYTLSKLLVCPKCHQTLSFCMKYNKRSARNVLDKSQRELYVLNCHASKGQKAKAESKGKPRCSNNGIRSARVLKKVLDELRLYLQELDKKIEAILEGDDSFLSLVARKQQELTLRYNQLDDQKKRIQDGFKVGIYTQDEASEEIKSIRRTQLVLKQELQDLEGADVKAEFDRKKQQKIKIEQLLLMDNDANPTKANKLLHELIDKVYYWKEKSDVGGEKTFEIKVEYK
ncbi:recombinase [Alkalihalobacillus alcalophilus ATCC 27647 = CGMCC 1.3604]|uniref:Recombinase n=1 Tax=Alkalihalobacillus alcalophilus ATCC 27647 = CGMCC 1.3604 TaxID=1218173 RepID=A0A094WIY2_ALKAL|nr:recombinase family protein [Alkalihalobacillus alcalophilus]KGA96771.1 recombinase [Alkalihalobacillus alcalophilus ATCC 27647 = CGMCC 1.3604]MED1563508.1 recombinase family protein [Alkalihalobacillus alcalophilus]THG92063.1 recombinase [Alkalihalobacillus alcalophilus ATCC 27647 = CGMCC 1.3604]